MFHKSNSSPELKQFTLEVMRQMIRFINFPNLKNHEQFN
jgi:hypothetical protein